MVTLPKQSETSRFKKEIGSSLTWKANFKRYTKLLVATNVFHHIHNMVTCHDCALNIWVSH